MTQSFRTLPFVWEQPAFYQLSIRAPNQLLSEISTFTFPLTPQSIRDTRNALSNVMDVQGNAKQQGVNRLIDRFGVAPPVYLIEGTTGWDRHMMDGYLLGGIQSMQLLKAFLDNYANLNEKKREAGDTNLFTLEFYDYFSLEFWVVEPVGPQIVRLSADRPQLTYYRFQWAAQRPAGFPILGEVDALLQVFGTPAIVAGVNAATTVGAIVTAYSPSGPAFGGGPTGSIGGLSL